MRLDAELKLFHYNVEPILQVTKKTRGLTIFVGNTNQQIHQLRFPFLCSIKQKRLFISINLQQFFINKYILLTIYLRFTREKSKWFLACRDDRKERRHQSYQI